MTKVTAYRLRRLVAHAGTICQMGVLMVGLTAIAAAGEPTPRPDPGSSGIADPFVPVVSYVQPPAAEPPPAEAQPAEPSALAELEQLLERPVLVPALEQEVTTVSRQESTVGRSPAAVFVITNDMIRRSGARSIPEVLRMAPGVHVARIDANKWAVTVRGFNSQFANKLLVQIDGRSIYTPFFGGVFWDTQDVVLEDVERIEVIRGPGATVWGANAVNGIINIITKKAGDTQGALVQGGAGTELRGSTTARYGGQLGENAHYRLYGQWYEQDRGYLPGNLAADDGGMGRGGFRVDWEPNPCDTVTVQGESYRGRAGNRNLFPDPTFPPPDLDFLRTVAEDTGLQGGHALFRYRHECDEDTDWSCQVYYDRTERHRPVTGFREDRDTIDLDFQHRFRWTPAQEIIWGFGYRNTKGKLRDFPAVVEFEPPVRADDLFSYFVQDEITLCEEFLYLTAGSKFEHNDYTSFEFQPTVRLLCTPTPRQSLWAAVSRAVRMPTQGEDDVRLPFLPQSTPLGPVFPQMVGSRSVEAEDLLAYEAGLRAQPTDRFSWDLAVFLHEYRDLVGLLPGAIPGDLIGWPDPLLGPYVSLPLGVRNLVDGQSYGAELAVNYEVTPCWRLYGAYSYFHLDLDAPRGVFSTSPPGQDPAHQLYLRSSWDLACHWELDVAWRYVDALSGLGVPGYNVADVRLAYRPTTAWELAVVGRQLLADKHPEFGADPFTGNVSTEVESEVYGMVTWRY